MNTLFPQMKQTVTINPANANWNFTPRILTDLVISTIRNNVYWNNEVNREPLLKIVTAMEYMSQSMKMHLPLVGEQYGSITTQLRQEINGLFLTEFSTHEILCGYGPVGKHIVDYIEMFKLCDTKDHIVDKNTMVFNPSKVDMENEYKKIFDYCPKPCQVDNKFVPEFEDILKLSAGLQNFGYLTQFYNNPSCDKYKKQTVIDLQLSDLISQYGNIDQTGIYYRELGYNSKTPDLLVLVAPIRDTKVACLINLSSQHPLHYGQLHYFHRAEHQWVKHRDHSGSWYLEGTYEALKEEAEKFLLDLGYSLKPNYDEQAHICYNYLKRLNEIADIMTDRGMPNTILDYIKDIKFLSNGSELPYKGITYTFNTLPTVIEDCTSERLLIQKNIGTGSWDSNKITITLNRIGDSFEVSTKDHELVLAFLLNDLKEYLIEMMPKVEEIIIPQYKEESISK